MFNLTDDEIRPYIARVGTFSHDELASALQAILRANKVSLPEKFTGVNHVRKVGEGFYWSTGGEHLEIEDVCYICGMVREDFLELVAVSICLWYKVQGQFKGAKLHSFLKDDSRFNRAYTCAIYLSQYFDKPEFWIGMMTPRLNR